MFARIFISSLAVLFCFSPAMADVYDNKIHQLEADFPAKVETFTDSPSKGTRIEMAMCFLGSQQYSTGVKMIEGYPANPNQLHELSDLLVKNSVKELCKGLDRIEILKQEDVKINPHCPMGVATLMRHDDGCLYFWVTIKNGKLLSLIHI